MKKLLFALFFLTVFSISAFSQEAWKIDEFGDDNCESYLARVDGVLNILAEYPASTVYVLIYEGKENIFNRRIGKHEISFPTYGLAKAKIRSMKKYLSLRKLPAERFKFVEAGFREELTTEFWLVPKDVMPPILKPTLTKIRHRKGKAKGFCIDSGGL